MIYCNSNSTHQFTKDQCWHTKVCHFCVKYHTIWDLVEFDELRIISIRSINNTANILTKPLLQPLFERLRGYLGVGPSCVTWGGMVSYICFHACPTLEEVLSGDVCMWCRRSEILIDVSSLFLYDYFLISIFFCYALCYILVSCAHLYSYSTWFVLTEPFICVIGLSWT